jgi:hypothetical protein
MTTINIFPNADTTAQDIYGHADDGHMGDAACTCRTCRRKANLRGTGPRVDGFDRDAEQLRGRYRAAGADSHYAK